MSELPVEHAQPQEGHLLSTTSSLAAEHGALAAVVAAAPVHTMDSLTTAMNDGLSMTKVERRGADIHDRVEEVRAKIIGSVANWLEYVNFGQEVPDYDEMDPLTLYYANPSDRIIDDTIQRMLHESKAAEFESHGVQLYMFRIATHDPQTDLVAQLSRTSGYSGAQILRRHNVYYELSCAGYDNKAMGQDPTAQPVNPEADQA